MENITYRELPNTYLGFTDSTKEPQKTRIQNSLDKLIRQDGSIYTIKTWIVNKIINGRVPEIEENVITYNRQGYQNKPKTEYRLIDKDKGLYNTLNKTEYNFALYLVNKGLNNEGNINDYLYKERLKLEQIQAENDRLEQEEKARQEAIERENNIAKSILENDVVTEKEKEIVSKIFFDIYGEENDWNYSLVPLIHHFDLQYCKDQIKSRLHNSNKASIKIFECITGLKLPNNNKERMEYLDGISSQDFKGIAEYKPRARREKKDIVLEDFYISKGVGNGKTEWVKVQAEGFTKYGIDFFIRKYKDNWSISVASVGVLIADGKTKIEAMDKLKSIIDSRGIESVNELIEEMKIKIIKQNGENPRYAKIG